MASPAVDCATGITVVFATSSFTMELLDINGPSASRGAIDTTHQGTTVTSGAGKYGDKTFIPEDFADGGEVELTGHYNPDNDVPMQKTDVAETITITEPGGATVAFSGFVIDTGIARPLNDKMTRTVTVKVTGAVTHTAAA